MKEYIEILNEILLGKYISRFSIGDTWDIYIDGFYLSTQSIEFEEENLINGLLKQHYKKIDYCVDKEDISKATILTANMRKFIIQIDLDEMKNLTIHFEKGSPLRISTNNEIVDWQWCINKSGKNPYSDYLIACFCAGEIKVNL